MPYAANGQISQEPIQGGIEVTDEQYAEALDGMLAGYRVTITDGFHVGPEPLPAPTPEPEPDWPALIAAKRFAMETAGVVWNRCGIATDDRSQSKLSIERSAAKDGLREQNSAWKCLDIESGTTVFRPTTNAEIVEIGELVYRYVAACYAREEELLALGYNINTADLDVGWP